MPKQLKKVTNSLSKVNKSRHKTLCRPSKRKRKKDAAKAKETNDKMTPETSMKEEDDVETCLPILTENDVASTTMNGSSISAKMSNGLNSQNNGTMENNFFLNRDISTLFNSLCYSEDVLSSLPNRTWAIHSTEIPEKRVVVSAMIMHNSHGTGLEPLYTKQIIFDEKLNFDLFLINSRMVLKDKPMTIRSMHDFEDLVDYVESLKLCPGGPSVSQYNSANPECAYKDPLNKWRHNLCSLEISNGDVCDSCQSLDEILRRWAQRSKASGKLRNSLIATKRKQRSRD